MQKGDLVMALLESAARIAATPAFGPAQRAMEAAKLQALLLNFRTAEAAQAQERRNFQFDTAQPSELDKRSKADAAVRAIIQYIRS